MCTTVGFKYKEGFVLGRTLEMGIKLENQAMYVPKDTEGFIKTEKENFSSKYNTLGTAFEMIEAFGDGINEKGLIGSSNLLPNYATFSDKAVRGKINMNTSNAFDYLLSRCKDVEEVKKEAEKIVLVKNDKDSDDISTDMHFFFMDAKGEKVVLEPKDGSLVAYDNPVGVLTNAPEFPWHITNLKNYINLNPLNVDEGEFNESTFSKFGEGTGMLGLPGDFTPPSRFVRSSYFVSNTPKDLDRNSAILQAFRILSQSDIPIGAVIGTEENSQDQAIYTAVMDTKEKAYFVKCHDNINIQSFYIDDYKDEKDIKMLEVKKNMKL